MWRGQMKYGTLWLFLAGGLMIVFLQFLSGESINRLIKGNKRLLGEVKVQNELRKLESDVLTVESDIRGVVITNDSTYLPQVKQKIQNIRKELSNLDKEFQQDISSDELALLDDLVHRKIAVSNTT